MDRSGEEPLHTKPTTLRQVAPHSLGTVPQAHTKSHAYTRGFRGKRPDERMQDVLTHHFFDSVMLCGIVLLHYIYTMIEVGVSTLRVHKTVHNAYTFEVDSYPFTETPNGAY